MKVVLRCLVAAMLVTALLTSGCSLPAKRYTIGQPVERSGLSVTVESISSAKQIEGFFTAIPPLKDEYAYVLVNLKLENRTDKALEPPTSWTSELLMSDGKPAAAGPTVMTNGPTGFSYLNSVKELQPGEATSTVAVFVAPVGGKLDKLVFHEWFKPKENVTVDLGGESVSPPERTVVGLGETMRVNGLDVTVHGITYPSKFTSSGFMVMTYSAPKGAHFVQLDVTIKNSSNSTPHNFGAANALASQAGSDMHHGATVIDSQDRASGREHLIGIDKDDAYPKPYWWDVPPLAKGDSHRAFMVFIVRDDSKDLHFVYRQPVLGLQPRVKLQ